MRPAPTDTLLEKSGAGKGSILLYSASNSAVSLKLSAFSLVP